MTTIELTTKINAPIEIVFDISRDIDVHQQSAFGTNEKAISGKTSGLIGLNETVAFRGKHFGSYLKHESLISAMEIPNYFVDEMLDGKFKSFRREHFFEFENGVTVMKDKLMYETPFGIFGKIFDLFLLEKYLTGFLFKRNQLLKTLAETNKSHQKIGMLSTQNEV